MVVMHHIATRGPNIFSHSLGDVMTNLEEEIRKARREIRAEAYAMSIGELANMYAEGDLLLTPVYQRLFRWDLRQKSQLIESILIGLPLPSVFVAADTEGRWEVVDGLQRISTLLEFMGYLKDEELENEDNHKIKPASVLGKTEYLPSLEGVAWDEEARTKNTPKGYLSEAQKRDLRRSKIDVKIIERDSDIKAKYDLFKRLNSNSSKLDPQEIRNAVIASESPEMVRWISRKASSPEFLNLMTLTQKRLKKKYNEEMLLRFLLLSHLSNENIKSISDFTKDIDNFAFDIAVNFESRKDAYDELFDATFGKLSEFRNIFHPWDSKNNKYIEKFSLSAFEAFASGVGYCVFNDLKFNDNFEEVSKKFWGKPEAKKITGSATEARIKWTVPAGRELLGASID